MRKTVRVMSQMGPEERLGYAVASMPRGLRSALAEVADREDLPLVAGVWRDDAGGCLVANVVATLDATGPRAGETLDLRILRMMPELSSRDLNRLIVAWDEAAAQEGRNSDGRLRRLLRGALARAEQADDTPDAGRPERMPGVAPSEVGAPATAPAASAAGPAAAR